MNIIQALNDPALFGPHFRGETWGAWRTFLKAWSGLGAEMTEAEAALFRQYTGRTALPDRPFDETTVIAGRRSGKSRVMGAIAVWCACLRD